MPSLRRIAVFALVAAVLSFVFGVIVDAFSSGESEPLLNRLAGAGAFGFVFQYAFRVDPNQSSRPATIAGVAAGLAILLVPNLSSSLLAEIIAAVSMDLVETIATDPIVALVWALLNFALTGGVAGSIAYAIAIRMLPSPSGPPAEPPASTSANSDASSTSAADEGPAPG
jgi:hypothetical protein